MIGEPYIRKKGKKFIIERKVNNRTEYIKTLPPIKELFFLLGVEASKFYEEKTNNSKTKASPKPQRLDESQDNLTNNKPNLPIITINRNKNKDANNEKE